MEQALDFLAECEALHDAVANLHGEHWEKPTQFKNWTVNDVLVHLHFWNVMADQSLTEPDIFQSQLAIVMAKGGMKGLREAENGLISLRGEELRDAWRKQYIDMAHRWAELDPKRRVQWAGPDMSVRSSITARQMETWAHGQEIFDLLGLERVEKDRIRNIIVLGVNTFGWAYKVNGLEVPECMPQLVLKAPSGEEWRFGEEGGGNRISGSAAEFAQVVAQTRNFKDTSLSIKGAIATEWMRIAQCFAGDAVSPPAPGSRYKVA